MTGECLDCGRSAKALSRGMCQACYKRSMRRDTRVGPLRILKPGDWLETPDGTARIGFIWEIDGDRVEVRSYECPETRGPTIRTMTRAQACWYRIVPNDRYGIERPLLEVAR